MSKCNRMSEQYESANEDEELRKLIDAQLLEKHPGLKDILTRDSGDNTAISVRAIYNYFNEAQINLSNFRNFQQTRYDNSPSQILEGDLRLVSSRIGDLKGQMLSENRDTRAILERFVTDYESQFEDLRASAKEFIQ